MFYFPECALTKQSCEHGQLNDTCQCECDEGWIGNLCSSGTYKLWYMHCKNWRVQNYMYMVFILGSSLNMNTMEE